MITRNIERANSFPWKSSTHLSLFPYNHHSCYMHLFRPTCSPGRPPMFAPKARYLCRFHPFMEHISMPGVRVNGAQAIWNPYRSTGGSLGTCCKCPNVVLNWNVPSSNFGTRCLSREIGCAQHIWEGSSNLHFDRGHENNGISNFPTRRNPSGTHPFSAKARRKHISEWNVTEHDRRERATGRGRGGGRDDKIYALGRLMTGILRHRATELNLNVRSDGYVAVNDLLKLKIRTLAGFPMCSHTVNDVKEAVKNDNKQRFSLVEENGQFLIRANQGHSIEVVDSEKLLKPILSPEEVPVCVHGTYRKYLESICKTGLSRMKRVHVHFATGLPNSGGVVSGMRRDCEILIFLDVQKALKDGMKLYLSVNGVVLTDGFDGIIPPSYFAKIETWPKRELID